MVTDVIDPELYNHDEFIDEVLEHCSYPTNRYGWGGRDNVRFLLRGESDPIITKYPKMTEVIDHFGAYLMPTSGGRTLVEATASVYEILRCHIHKVAKTLAATYILDDDKDSDDE